MSSNLMDSMERFFDRPELRLPIEWRWGEDPGSSMRSRTDEFFSILGKVSSKGVDKTAILRSKKTSELLMKAFECSLKGDIASSFPAFEAAMTNLGDALPKGDESTCGTGAKYRDKLLFRMRNSQKQHLDKEDLFHIPFQKRFKVASERFSVVGAPCLYLGGSVYTCWEEMGRPPFQDLHVSAFWIAEPTAFLDLRMTPSAISKKLKSSLWKDRGDEREQFARSELSKLAHIWPLMALCMMKVDEPDGAFKPEYIVPQMTLQWIATNGQLDGVAYASCQTLVRCQQGIESLSNYAFPVKHFQASGRCVDLCKRFRMTDPINWSLLGAMDLHVGERPEEYGIRVADGVESSSGETEFGKIERALFALRNRISRMGLQNEGVVSHL